MYKAIITPIRAIRSHSDPKVHSLNLATACGYQVIVSKTVEEGTLGVFFGPDGCLSDNYLKENNLYRHSEKNRDPEKKGYFENNGRVKAIKFRGEKSEGYWTHLKELEWTGVDISTLEEGFQFDTLNGNKVCEKYFSRATRERINQQKNKSKKKSLDKRFPYFQKHFDTAQLKQNISFIPEGAILYISSKIHGTSARTGYLPEFEVDLPWYKRWWRKLIPAGEKFSYISGTRNVTLDPNVSEEVGYYSGSKFRNICHNYFKSIGLKPSETIYYEICGYDERGKGIMPSHEIKDKELKKMYGNKMTYKYGCHQEETDNPLGENFRIFVYRITVSGPDGTQYEMPWYWMQYRCEQLGLESVPIVTQPFVYDSDKEKLLELCTELADGPDLIDPSHIREGIVVRVEHPKCNKFMKLKGFWFQVLEGLIKEQEDYIDPEEIS